MRFCARATTTSDSSGFKTKEWMKKSLGPDRYIQVRRALPSFASPGREDDRRASPR
jgi:hypothetical protein